MAALTPRVTAHVRHFKRVGLMDFRCAVVGKCNAEIHSQPVAVDAEPVNPVSVMVRIVIV